MLSHVPLDFDTWTLGDESGTFEEEGAAIYLERSAVSLHFFVDVVPGYIMLYILSYPFFDVGTSQKKCDVSIRFAVGTVKKNIMSQAFPSYGTAVLKFDPI